MKSGSPFADGGVVNIKKYSSPPWCCNKPNQPTLVRNIMQQSVVYWTHAIVFFSPMFSYTPLIFICIRSRINQDYIKGKCNGDISLFVCPCASSKRTEIFLWNLILQRLHCEALCEFIGTILNIIYKKLKLNTDEELYGNIFTTSIQRQQLYWRHFWLLLFKKILQLIMQTVFQFHKLSKF
jgi:hypothetical protein